jgi:hypothetical protein
MYSIAVIVVPNTHLIRPAAIVAHTEVSLLRARSVGVTAAINPLKSSDIVYYLLVYYLHYSNRATTVLS